MDSLAYPKAQLTLPRVVVASFYNKRAVLMEYTIQSLFPFPMKVLCNWEAQSTQIVHKQLICVRLITRLLSHSTCREGKLDYV